MGIQTMFNPLGINKKPFIPNQIIIESRTPQTNEIELPSGSYKVICVGAGGGGSTSVTLVSMGSGGGSGGCVEAKIKLYHGLYRYTIGKRGIKNDAPQGSSGNCGENSQLYDVINNTSIVIAGGGQGAFRPTPEGLGGQTDQNTQYAFLEYTALSGNKGTKGDGWSSGKGGVAVAYNAGKGGGGDGDAENADNGYFKLIYLGEDL